jgi:EAL domain-containing protein (putative c-di-GMP-specific phosphodiesterase class I)
VLQQMHCHHAQGYHISRPVHAEELRDWLERAETSGKY